ncbi:hypothetical protein [Noviherbaspirillum denitrificans]|nr:hypothetical protein [Noviherbaspirillum denitrificans]
MRTANFDPERFMFQRIKSKFGAWEARPMDYHVNSARFPTHPRSPA